jgi:Ca-activated chloride channel family protein
VSWTTRAYFPERSRENPFVARLWATQRVGYLSAEKRKNGGSREIDDEIRDLGDRFGIPTEFSSYLVVEPGMNRRQAAIGSGQLSQVVVTGATTARTAAPAAVPFEAAKAAAAQRSATNMSMADAAVGARDDANVQRAGNVTLVLRDSVWTDVKYKRTGEVLRVKAYSDAYFKLLELQPDLRDAFSVGERVIVAGRGMAIELTPSGVDRLSDRDLAMLRDRW